MGERRGRVKSRNTYRGLMDRDNQGRIKCGRRMVGMVGKSNGGKWGHLYLNNNKKIEKKKYAIREQGEISYTVKNRLAVSQTIKYKITL